VKKALYRIFYAASLDDAHDEASKFLARYEEEFPTATEVLGKHRSLCLTFYHFPERHWRNLGFDDGVWSSGRGAFEVAKGYDESSRYCLDRGGSKIAG
jgi:hypothetical protein